MFPALTVSRFKKHITMKILLEDFLFLNCFLKLLLKKIGFEPMKEFILTDLQSVVFNHSTISSLLGNGRIELPTLSL